MERRADAWGLAGSRAGRPPIYSGRRSARAAVAAKCMCARVAMVLGYVLLVSLVAIILSAYYVFMWEPVEATDGDLSSTPTAGLMPGGAAHPSAATEQTPTAGDAADLLGSSRRPA
ncbi:unnamed protein product [Lampetra planeri]